MCCLGVLLFAAILPLKKIRIIVIIIMLYFTSFYVTNQSGTYFSENESPYTAVSHVTWVLKWLETLCNYPGFSSIALMHISWFLKQLETKKLRPFWRTQWQTLTILVRCVLLPHTSSVSWHSWRSFVFFLEQMRIKICLLVLSTSIGLKIGTKNWVREIPLSRHYSFVTL